MDHLSNICPWIRQTGSSKVSAMGTITVLKVANYVWSILEASEVTW